MKLRNSAKPALLALVLGVTQCSLACSIFSDADNGTVLAGRNWDMLNESDSTVMWFVPAAVGEHGRVCFGRHDDCEDGMNDQGLFVAIAATRGNGKFVSKQRALSCGAALEGLLRKCATVEEAIAWLTATTNIIINGSVRGNSRDGFVNSGIGGHYLIADKRGESVVCEWEKGKPKFLRKNGRYQLVTNFLLTKPEGEDETCPRFCLMTDVLKRSQKPSLEVATRALKAGSRTLTRYSQVYDLVNGEVHLFFNHDFAAPKRIRLADELRKGHHEVALQQFFGVPANYVAMPKISNEAEISGEQIFARSVEARGGQAAANRIKSYRALGTLALDFGWVEPSSFETVAVRPNKSRYVFEMKMSLGTNQSFYSGGFDGKNGWKVEGGARKMLKGGELEEKRADAEFFA